MILLVLLAGCLQPSPLPELGACAEYPEGTYEYGQVGIGTCIAGPLEMEFAEAEDGSDVLLLTNSNPYQLFTGGSLLAIPWDEVDESAGFQTIDSIGAVALGLPSFASALGRDDDLGLVGVRLSEDARTRSEDDDLWLVDLSDPASPSYSTRGTNGTERLTVEADPVDVVVDEASRFAFVANRTAHSVSVVDLGAQNSDETVEIILPWPESSIAAAEFEDVDGSGSRGVLSNLEILDEELVPDDTWTLTWVEGTWRLWLPEEDGLARLSSPGDGSWTSSALGLDLDPEDSGGVTEELRTPFYIDGDASGRMLFADGDDIVGAQAGSYAGDWAFEAFTTFPGREGSWDVSVSGPSYLVDADAHWLWYAASDLGETDGTEQWGIGLASSADGTTFSRETLEPVLSPTWDHESERISEPFVLWDPQTSRWRMFYSAFDGTQWTIGHATSSDRLTWTSDAEPLFVADAGADAAAPVISMEEGRFRLWYAHRDDTGLWDMAAAESPDGRTWTDLGPLGVLAETGEQPPRAAMQSSLTAGFTVEGEQLGSQLFPLTPGLDFAVDIYGWALRTEVGFHLGEGDFGSSSNGGVRVGSVLEDEGMAWLTQWDAGGTPRIATAALADDGSLLPQSGVTLDLSESFERDGASEPVVFDVGGTLHMLYAGYRGEARTLGLATSSDGSTWSKQGQVLGLSEDWDSAALVPHSVIELEDGSYQLWYAGSNGESWRVGTATSSDGTSWTREAGSQGFEFGAGAPGDFDDSGVRYPWAVPGVDEDGNAGLHLWYSGYDGANWRIGYAFRDDATGDWSRATNGFSGESRPVVALGSGTFHPLAVEAPVMLPGDDDDGDGVPDSWSGYYAGSSSGIWRAGRLVAGVEPDRVHKVFDLPTLGDTLGFTTEKGNADTKAIPLDATFDGLTITGVGLTALELDSERGFLYAVSKQTSFVTVIDIRDDSDEASGFVDANYLDIEAIITVAVPGGAIGFRQVQTIPGEDRMLALHDQPESIMLIDLSELTDESYGRAIYDAQIGYMPASRGVETDEGADSQTSVGPAQFVVHADGRRIFVSNYNSNSISVYDLALGPYGQLVAEVDNVGENPYALAFDPTGTRLVFANYTGETEASGFSTATLGVLDIDESSDSYLSVLTWIGNL